MEIPEGCITVIAGENGSGKSVLMSILAGLEDADRGEIFFDEEPNKKIGKKIGMVFQEAATTTPERKKTNCKQRFKMR